MNKNYQIIVRLDDESYQQWKLICDTLKGTTRSDVFRRILKRLSASLADATNINYYGE